MLLMRWQIAFPYEPLTFTNASLHIGYQWDQIWYHLGVLSNPPTVPVAVTVPAGQTCFMEWLFGKAQMPGGVMTGDFYNTLGAMHGTVMVFFGIVPVAFAAFGNFVMPLQIGTVDMAFPRLNMGSVILFFISAVLMSAASSCRVRGQGRVDLLYTACDDFRPTADAYAALYVVP